MDDKTIRLHCVQELDYLPQVDAAHIGVIVAAGVVILTGRVATYAEKATAERAILQMRGVRAVVQQIEVCLPDHLRVGDEVLADRCARAIAWDSTIRTDSIMVKVEKGCVTLSGWVERYDQKAAADRTLRQLAGVTDIVNLIEVSRTRPEQAASIHDKERTVAC